MTDFTRAIQIDPSLASAYTNRGLVHRQTGKDDAALADFTRSIEMNPGYGPAYLARGNLLRARGQPDQALADLNQAIRLNRKARKRCIRAACSTSALASIRRRSRISTPRSTATPMSRRPIPRAGKPHRGRQARAGKSRISPPRSMWTTARRCLAGRGLALEKQGKRQEASESYQRAISVDANNSVARAGLGRLGQRI